MDPFKKRCAAGDPAAICFLRCVALCGRHHFCTLTWPSKILTMPTWNGLFWIIQLFISINAVAKSFLQESRNRMLYYQTITSPRNFILAKLLIQSVLDDGHECMSCVLFSLFMGYPVVNSAVFITIVFLGGWSLSLVFTFLAAIAAKAQSKCGHHGNTRFPNNHSPIDRVNENFLHCFQRWYTVAVNEYSFTTCFRYHGRASVCYPFSFSVERLKTIFTIAEL